MAAPLPGALLTTGHVTVSKETAHAVKDAKRDTRWAASLTNEFLLAKDRE